MEKSTESLFWQIAVGVGGIAAGFLAAFRRLRLLPKTVNGHGLAIMSMEIEVKKIIGQMRSDMERSFEDNKESLLDLLDRVRENSSDIKDIKRRLKRLEGDD